VHAAHQDKNTYIFKNLNSSVFKYIIAGNNLKPFRVRITYTNTSIIDGQGTITLLKEDETNNDETNQAKDETAALKAEGEKIEKKNEIFPDKSYIPEDRMFAVII
jgi:cell division protein FtsB